MVEIVRRFLVAAISLGVIAGNSDNIARFFDDTVALGQKVATAGDLRSISIMLDYEMMRYGRYPRTGDFAAWMALRFKENQLKSLTTDHWGHELVYEASPDRKRYRLFSFGPDGVAGTSDDMTHTGP